MRVCRLNLDTCLCVAHNDFIFAVLAEEWGLVGSVFALFAYAIVIFGCLKMASSSADMFGRLISSSIAVLLMVHLFINVGMTLGITPITGLPLPFMSYGGSFIITCFVMMGVVQSVYRYRKNFSMNRMRDYDLFRELNRRLINSNYHGSKTKPRNRSSQIVENTLPPQIILPIQMI